MYVRVYLSNLADSLALDTCSLGLTEGHIKGKLNGQSSHGASGQGLNLADGLRQGSLGAVGLERDLVLHTAGIVDHSHTRGLWAYIQPLDDFSQEDFNLLKFRGAHTTGAVNDEHQISGASVAQTCRCGGENRETQLHIL